MQPTPHRCRAPARAEHRRCGRVPRGSRSGRHRTRAQLAEKRRRAGVRPAAAVSRPADRRRSLPTMMLAPERRRCGLPWWWCAERSVRRLRSAVESSGGGWGRVLSPRVRVDLTRFSARRASLPTTPSIILSPRLSSPSRGACRAASCIASQPWRSATEAASCRTQSWRPRGCPSSPSRECQA